MLKAWSLAAAAFLAGVSTSFAQSDEIIVTGSRIANYEADIVPVIHLERKADFMVVKATVESDSRDANLRSDEVLKTLEAMAARADRDARIELGILRSYETADDEIEIVAPFDRSALKADLLAAGRRADTSSASIIVKTPIDATQDTFDTAKSRIDAFLKGVPVAGRALVTADDEPGLSIVDLGQYRAPLLNLLAEDNAAIKTVFGDDYVVSVSGLEQPVRWRVTGPLDLTLYFPYKSAVSPK